MKKDGGSQAGDSRVAGRAEQLEAELRRVRFANEVQARMFTLLGRITAEHSADDICRATVEGVRELMGFERAGLFLWDEEIKTFRGTWGTDMDLKTVTERDYVIEILPDSPEEHILAGALIERGCKLGAPPARPGEEHVKADLVGLRLDGKLYGVLSVDNRLSRRPITDEELEHLQLLSQVLGNALEISMARVVLAQTEERFRQVAENSGEWIWELDREGRYTYSSPVAETILGFAPGAVIGNTIAHRVVENDREPFTAAITGALGTGRPLEKFRSRHLHRDGFEVVLETSGIAVTDAQGKAIGYRGVHRDVTREAELEAQLRHSQKIDAIGRLAGGIAHDFNNLLTAILGCGSLVLDEVSVNDPVREDIERIRTAGERAAALTRQLLAFSRRQVMHVRSLSVSETLGEMEILLRRTIGEDIELVTQYGSDVPPIDTDADQLQQIVLHLALNARDAMTDPEFLSKLAVDSAEVRGVIAGMEHRAKRLVIETSRAELDAAFCAKHVGVSPGTHVLITLSDTGVGMPKEVRDHLFEPFFTTKQVGRGSGLGLSTVYGIVKQMGGYIQVDSRFGSGSTFRIYLPLRNAKAVRPPAPEKEGRKLQGKETILVVEDEEVVRNLTVRMLQTLGYGTLQARHGVEALEIIQSTDKPIDLILTDMIMPQMSGKQFVEELRRLGTKSKILFVSGYSSDDTVGGKVIGVDTPLIQKPFTRDLLARKIRDLLDAKE